MSIFSRAPQHIVKIQKYYVFRLKQIIYLLARSIHTHTQCKRVIEVTLTINVLRLTDKDMCYYIVLQIITIYFQLQVLIRFLMKFNLLFTSITCNGMRISICKVTFTTINFAHTIFYSLYLKIIKIMTLCLSM